MKTADFLRQHDACLDGAHWAMSVSDDMADVWDALIEQGRHDWLLWTATRQGVFHGAALRKLACRLVRETPLMDGRVVWDLLTDERSRRAVEVAESCAAGNATDDDLDAARSASYAARAAADAAEAAYDVYDDSAAAHAAAYAAYDSAYTTRAASASSFAAYAAYAASGASYSAARSAARAAAYAAQVKMIAELGNPFKKGASE